MQKKWGNEKLHADRGGVLFEEKNGSKLVVMLILCSAWFFCTHSAIHYVIVSGATEKIEQTSHRVYFASAKKATTASSTVNIYLVNGKRWDIFKK